MLKSPSPAMCKPILGFYIAGDGRSPEKRRELLMMPQFKGLGFTSLQTYKTHCGFISLTEKCR